MAQWKTQRPDLDVVPIGVIGRLHRLSARIADDRVAEYGKFGLGSGEFELLTALLRSGPPYEMSPSHLADWTMVSSGAVTKRVDRCVEQGWVTRRVGTGDGRSRVIALTDDGLELAQRVHVAHIAKLQGLVEPLSEAERDQLSALLEKWGRALDA